MTNGDWLRAQDDDAMAVFIMAGEIFVRTSSARNDKAVTMKEILDWLKEEQVELKPCPFCGSDDIDFGINYGTLKEFDYVECQNCGAEIHAIHQNGKCIAAIDAWNRRAEDD